MRGNGKDFPYAPVMGPFPLPAAAVACAACIMTVCLLALWSERFQHWFVIPLVLCGSLMGGDAVAWLRGELDTLDPKGLVGFFGVHFFFLSPLLHVFWGYWMWSMDSPEDWRTWLGWLGVLNAVGILCYLPVANKIAEGVPYNQGRGFREIVEHRFVVCATGLLVMSAALQILVYYRLGGPAGYVQAAAHRTGGDSFQGLGWLVIAAEVFPLVALMAFAVWARGRSWVRRRPVLFVAAIAFFVLKFAFGGLRGSRTSTIIVLVWFAGIIYFWVRRFSAKTVLLGLGCLIAFSYGYGFYKSMGTDALQAFGDSGKRERLVRQTGRSMQALLLGDLARSDVQAYLLYRLYGGERNYRFAWGRTYLGAAASVVPSWIWHNRPETKVREGTEIQYGIYPGAHTSLVSTRQYGFAGEAMLNFGPAAVPIFFAAFGAFVGLLRRFLRSWTYPDARLLFLPFLLGFPFVLLLGDSDNWVVLFVKDGMLPLAFMLISSRRIPRYMERAGREAGLREEIKEHDRPGRRRRIG